MLPNPSDSVPPGPQPDPQGSSPHDCDAHDCHAHDWGPEAPTQELLTRARGGDPQAAGALFEARGERVLLYIRLRMGAKLASEMEAMDVLQETWVQALEGLERFESQGAGAFAAWLCRIAEHRLADLGRRGTRAKRTPPGRLQPVSALLDQARRSAAGPLTLAARAERDGRLEQALQELSPDEREAALLRHFQGLTLEQIAHQTGSSSSAVRRRLGRAIGHLGRALAPQAE